jgi:Uma2 family endonuclease
MGLVCRAAGNRIQLTCPVFLKPMTLAKDLDPVSSVPSPSESSPPRWDLPPEFPPGNLLSDEPPLETEFHLRQLFLLFSSLEWLWRDRQDFYCAGNLTIYYSPNQRKSEDFRGPDFFVVLDTDRKPRNSWTVWHENGKYPNVIIEVLSASTAATDRGLKKQIYQDTFRTPEYFWFDPVTQEFQGFELVRGHYHPLQPNGQGWLWSQELKLFLGIQRDQLRFFTSNGDLVLTPPEAALAEQERSAIAQQEAAQAQQEAAQAQQEAAQAQQDTAAMEALLARYRSQFGDLPQAQPDA